MLRSVVITGGNSGLGLACAREIARQPGYAVTLACRDEARGREAAARILRSNGNANVNVRVLDLASLQSVRRFAAETGPLYGLVCNAGVQTVRGRDLTADGLESTFAVNHLAHFQLANLLLDRIVDGGRIIFVSSNTHDPKNLTGMPAPQLADAAALAHDLAMGGAAGRRRYTTSKLCNVLTAYEMHRRAGGRVRVNAFDPGLMPGTGLARDYGAAARVAYCYVLPALTLFVPNVNRVGTSGRRLGRLVTDAEYDVSGRYFSRGRDTASSKESYDLIKARRLWEGSVALVAAVEAKDAHREAGPAEGPPRHER
jgi:NAD(P)-dependent dehydrogenase (short-subunit alcohol dehydrogenase family)